MVRKSSSPSNCIKLLGMPSCTVSQITQYINAVANKEYFIVHKEAKNFTPVFVEFLTPDRASLIVKLLPRIFCGSTITIARMTQEEVKSNTSFQPLVDTSKYDLYLRGRNELFEKFQLAFGTLKI